MDGTEALTEKAPGDLRPPVIQTREQAQSASAALEAIAQSVSGIDERNLVIASAAEEQAQVAREVDRNLVRIRDLSVQTAAGAEQTRAASQQLSELAVELNRAILPRDRYETLLQDGDRLEIVSFVGGG